MVFSLSNFSEIKAMAMIPNKLITKRVMVKERPIEVLSNINMGIFVVDHAPKRTKTFLKEDPFLSKVMATGKAAYNGPAATDPNKKAMSKPNPLDSGPISFIIFSLSTHTSSSPIRMKIGGTTISNSVKERIDPLTAGLNKGLKLK